MQAMCFFFAHWSSSPASGLIFRRNSNLSQRAMVSCLLSQSQRWYCGDALHQQNPSISVLFFLREMWIWQWFMQSWSLNSFSFQRTCRQQNLTGHSFQRLHNVIYPLKTHCVIVLVGSQLECCTCSHKHNLQGHWEPPLKSHSQQGHLLLVWETFQWNILFIFLFIVFLRQGFSVWLRLFLNFLCRPGWPWSKRYTFCFFPSFGNKGVCYHACFSGIFWAPLFPWKSIV